VVNRKGRVVGAVTSCSIDSEGWLTGLAYVQDQYTKVQYPLGCIPGRPARPGPKAAYRPKRPANQVQLHDAITVIKRFLIERSNSALWAKQRISSPTNRGGPKWPPLCIEGALPRAWTSGSHRRALQTEVALQVCNSAAALKYQSVKGGRNVLGLFRLYGLSNDR